MIYGKIMYNYIIQIEVNMSSVCNDNLRDIEYLDHMIPHHQVAVDISLMLQKQTKSAKMQKILRELIRIQIYEIEMMKMMRKRKKNMKMSEFG